MTYGDWIGLAAICLSVLTAQAGTIIRVMNLFNKIDVRLTRIETVLGVVQDTSKTINFIPRKR